MEMFTVDLIIRRGLLITLELIDAIVFWLSWG